MTVSELIEELQKYPESDDVLIRCISDDGLTKVDVKLCSGEVYSWSSQQFDYVVIEGRND